MIARPKDLLNHPRELHTPLSSLKGIGPKRAQLLAQRGLGNIRDLLFFLPLRYEDRSRTVPIKEAEEGRAVLVKGVVLYGGEVTFFGTGKRVFRIMIQDRTASLELIWFQFKGGHLRPFTRKGLEIIAFGKVGFNRGRRQMIHPDLDRVDPEDKGIPGVRPVYPSVPGVPGRVLREGVGRALEKYGEMLEDPLPSEVIQITGLPGLKEALKGIHAPSPNIPMGLLNSQNTRFHRRLVFDRFFCFMFPMAFRKRHRRSQKGPVIEAPRDLQGRLKGLLPFTLTGDQFKAVQEIARDLSGGRPMNRLLQGDVGCGKTAVAAVATYLTILKGWQVAVMVPTQVLARQHHTYFSTFSRSMGFRPALLTGALKGDERRRLYQGIGRGDYNVIIGTQALIQEGLAFAGLGLVIIDEQHRFGVRQRALLGRKGENAHVLVMTATPIPRTLALTLYADLELSVIREYPAGRRPVITHLVGEAKKREIYRVVKDCLTREEQVMVVCPVIEGSQDLDLKNALDMHRKLERLFPPPFQVGLIHGRLAPEEKDRVMEHFRTGEIQLLVGTTVIEVGIHAPKATLMVVEHPERFGLTQLHQLRGRVGRGQSQGRCLLVAPKGLSPEALSRLEILAQCHDGFEIAQRDLELRGQGELTGLRQAGPGELDLTEVLGEPELLRTARREAERVVEDDPGLCRPENRSLAPLIRGDPRRPLDL